MNTIQLASQLNIFKLQTTKDRDNLERNQGCVNVTPYLQENKDKNNRHCANKKSRITYLKCGENISMEFYIQQNYAHQFIASRTTCNKCQKFFRQRKIIWVRNLDLQKQRESVREEINECKIKYLFFSLFNRCKIGLLKDIKEQCFG